VLRGALLEAQLLMYLHAMMIERRIFCLVVALSPAVGIAGCGSGKSGSADAGLACGNTQCASGQVCCIDCDGKGTCGAPGTACAGVACLTDGGTHGSDAGTTGDAGINCGNVTCGANQVCCLDCNQSGTCGPPGTPCSGSACIRCGLNGAACCAQAMCDPGLTCCVGVPYPQGGECGQSCGLKSDRRAKQDLREVDVEQILARVVGLPVHTWSYIGDTTGARHIGPMAQDFSAAFGFGSSDRRIDPVDANGVLVVSVQALKHQVDALREENAALRRDLSKMRAVMNALQRERTVDRDQSK
jgi:hypothetical protein